MTRIKICGITNKKDALAAAGLGIDMLGFVFYEKSKRYVKPSVVCDIASDIPPAMGRVGIFVDEERESVLKTAIDGCLNMLQFHGDETPEYCASMRGEYKVIKAFRIKDRQSLKTINDYDVDYYLLDTYDKSEKGGTGTLFDWKIIQDFEFLKPVIISGGITPDNVGKAIRELAPYGVDVSTGVETSPGIKDHSLMKKFVENARKM